MSTHCHNCSQPILGSKDPNRKYCSLSCSTVDGRARITASSTARNQHKRNQYEECPKHCAYCGTVMDYSMRRNKFCSQSCSAHKNNDQRKRSNPSIYKKSRATLLQNFISKYDLNPKTCLCCAGKIAYADRKKKFCSTQCVESYIDARNTTKRLQRPVKTPVMKPGPIKSKQKKSSDLIKCTCAKTGSVFYSPTWRKYSDQAIYEELKLYRNACKFTFGIGKQFPNSSLIEQHGWYHPVNNPQGISRDHKFSVVDGFKLGIDPEIMKHPANCEIMIHKHNQHKNRKSSITYEDLLKLIEEWPFK